MSENKIFFTEKPSYKAPQQAKSLPIPSYRTWLVWGFWAIVSFIQGIFIGKGVEMSAPLTILSNLIFALLLVDWYRFDNRQYEKATSFRSEFVFFVWPILLPYHMYKTRGIPRTLFVIAMLIGVLLFASLAGVGLASLGR